MIEPIKKRKYDILSFGEVMLRLSPAGSERIAYSESFDKRAGGSELNVVSGACMLGLSGGLITKLPENEIGKYARRRIRFSGVDDSLVSLDSRPEARLGIYYCESGAYPRQSVVSYDRRGSSFTALRAEELPEEVFSSAAVFHTCGITPSLGESIKKETLKIIEGFKRGGALISFDVNYRATLWSEEEARACIFDILPLVDILFVSEETLRRMFGMSGSLREIHRSLARQFPTLKLIASTRRGAKSPRRQDFTSLAYDCGEDVHYEESPYEDIEVVDRIGSGDAYVAGALFALCRFCSAEQMVKYGNAMAALKNTTLGDMPECDLSDVQRIIRNHSAQGDGSEMVR